MTFSVYIITHTVSLKAYVGFTGLTMNRRFQKHCSDARKGEGWLLHKAMRKYGTDMFSVDMLATAETRTEAAELEKWYIVEFDTRAPTGYNLTDGGDGALGYRHTQEFKTAMSKRQTGQKLPPEQIEGMRQRMLGWVPSEATRKLMAANQIGRIHGSDTIEKMSASAKRRWATNPTYFSLEHNERLRTLAVGRVPTQAHRHAISKALRGKKRSVETVERMRASAIARWARTRAANDTVFPETTEAC